MAKDMSITCSKWGTDLTSAEANALLIMLNEAIEMHFYDGSGIDLKDWEFFDLDAARLTAYHKFRTAYQECYSEEPRDADNR